MKTTILEWVKLTILVSLLAGQQVIAATPPSGLIDTLLLPSSPDMVTTGAAYEPGTSHLWVIDKGANSQARIRVLDRDDGSVTEIPLQNVDTPLEKGLLGIAFSPDYLSGANHVYFYYSRSNRNRVSRFTVNGHSISNELVVFETDSSPDWAHNGGGIRFAPDKTLYIATGDQFSASRPNPLARDLSDPHGKILRINADGSIPADNPFIGQSGVMPQIWAWGLRHPFRIGMDTQTGRPIIGNVGEESWEGLFLGVPGADYGAPCLENGHPWKNCSTSSSLQQPIFDYSQNNQTPVFGEAVIGGPVYRRSEFPVQYHNAYFFGDYAHGWIRYGFMGANGRLENVQLFMDDSPNLVDLIISPAGCLTWTSTTEGVHEVCNPAVNENNAPKAVATGDPLSGAAPLTVNFEGSGSTDPDGDSLAYLWDFGDGNTSNQANPSHTYENGGVFNAVLTVNDQRGTDVSFDQATPLDVVVGLNQAPTGTITLPGLGANYSSGDTIHFAGTAADPEDGVLVPDRFSWVITFHHDTHTHPFLGPFEGINSGSFTIPVDHEGSTNVWYRIHLTVTDSGDPVGSDAAIATSTYVDVHPNTANITIAAKPVGWGLQVEFDGALSAAPKKYNSVVNIPHRVSVPAYQQRSLCMKFHSWSDGGAREHYVSTAPEDITITATYSIAGLNCPTAPVYEYRLSSGQWHQISLPAVPSGENTVATVFGNDIPGTYGTDWVMYAFDAATGTYINQENDGILIPGVGYWIIQLSGNDVLLELPINSTTVPLTQSAQCPEELGCFENSLQTSPGSINWNMVGYPFDSGSPWSGAMIVNSEGNCEGGCTPQSASSQDVMHHQLWHYNPAQEDYDLVENDTFLTAWTGYWGATLSAAGNNLKLLLHSD